MIAWFAKNHVAANLLLISIVLAGLFSLSTKIPLEVFPSFEADTISVYRYLYVVQRLKM